VEREAERVKEQQPREDQYDRGLKWRMEKTRQRKEGKVVLHAEDIPWQTSRQGYGRHYIGPANWAELAAPGWTISRSSHVMEKRGTHSHVGGGPLLYILEGRGYTVNNGRRFDWEEGDLEIIPVTPTENEHYHVNLNPGQPCGRIRFHHWALEEAVSYETRQVTDSPEWKGPRDETVYRPADFVPESASRHGYEIATPDGTLLDDLFMRRNQWRERMASAKLVVKGRELPLENNRMGLYRWYVHPSFTDVGCHHLLFWSHEIPPGSRSGVQKHQGGRIHFVIQGRGYTIVDDKRHDWEKEDVVLLPIKTGGCIFQHFNADPQRPAKMVVAEVNWTDVLGPDIASGFEQLEDSPDYHGHRP